MFGLIRSPEVALLMRRLAVVRDLLVSAVQETDQLANHQIISLEATYWAIFGDLEIQLYAMTLKRDQTAYRIRLIRQALNHDRPIDLPAIQRAVARKFASRVAHLAAMRGKLHDALTYLALPTLSTDETDELNDLYKMLVKALHPDLHPAQSAADQRLFLFVLEAYANGLLEVLRLIAAIVREQADAPATPKELNQQLTKLTTALNAQFDRQARLKGRWPMTIAKQLSDARWRGHHQAEMQLALNKLKLQVAANNVLYGQLVGDLGGDKND